MEKNIEVIDNRGEDTKPGYPKRDPTSGKKKEKAWTGINYQNSNTRQSLRRWRMWMSILNWRPCVQNHDWRQTQRKSPLSSNLRTRRTKEKSYVHAKGRCVTSRNRETQSGFGVSTGTLNHIRWWYPNPKAKWFLTWSCTTAKPTGLPVAWAHEQSPCTHPAPTVCNSGGWPLLPRNLPLGMGQEHSLPIACLSGCYTLFTDNPKQELDRNVTCILGGNSKIWLIIIAIIKSPFLLSFTMKSGCWCWDSKKSLFTSNIIQPDRS